MKVVFVLFDDAIGNWQSVRWPPSQFNGNWILDARKATHPRALKPSNTSEKLMTSKLSNHIFQLNYLRSVQMQDASGCLYSVTKQTWLKLSLRLSTKHSMLMSDVMARVAGWVQGVKVQPYPSRKSNPGLQPSASRCDGHVLMTQNRTHTKRISETITRHS